MRLIMPCFLHFEPAPDLDYDGDRRLQAQEYGGKEIRIFHFVPAHQETAARVLALLREAYEEVRIKLDVRRNTVSHRFFRRHG